MTESHYASDLRDEEWALLEPLLTRTHPAGRKQAYSLRRIVDALFYLLRTGVQWRFLPHEYPSPAAVFYHYARWRRDGTWERINTVLRERHRQRIGRTRQPSAAIIDSQSAKTTEASWGDRVPYRTLHSKGEVQLSAWISDARASAAMLAETFPAGLEHQRPN